ncbi:kazal-like domain-containing protein [Trichonephila clavipes]|nr:kazal-like domain-containing protein [Trichonephila clavipes]
MDVCKCIAPLWHGGTLNSNRAASPLVWLVEREERLGVTAVSMAGCVFIPKCPEVCLPFHDPVCGSDGRIYINLCRMLQDNCGKDVKKMPSSFCVSAAQGNLPRG